MICKSGDYKNGYIFTPNSCNDDLQEILNSYDKVNCIICNENTKKNFKTPLLGHSIITINNKLVDGVFFVNGCY